MPRSKLPLAHKVIIIVAILILVAVVWLPTFLSGGPGSPPLNDSPELQVIPIQREVELRCVLPDGQAVPVAFVGETWKDAFATMKRVLVPVLGSEDVEVSVYEGNEQLVARGSLATHSQPLTVGTPLSLLQPNAVLWASLELSGLSELVTSALRRYSLRSIVHLAYSSHTCSRIFASLSPWDNLNAYHCLTILNSTRCSFPSSSKLQCHAVPSFPSGIQRLLWRGYVNPGSVWLLWLPMSSRTLHSCVEEILARAHDDRELLLLPGNETTIQPTLQKLRPSWSLVAENGMAHVVWVVGHAIGAQHWSFHSAPPPSLHPTVIAASLPFVSQILHHWEPRSLSQRAADAIRENLPNCIELQIIGSHLYFAPNHHILPAELKPWELSRTRWLVSLLLRLLDVVHFPDPISFFVCLGDCVEGIRIESSVGPVPVLSPVRCPSVSADLPFPSLGSHNIWGRHNASLDDIAGEWMEPADVPVEERAPAVVFRGGLRPQGCQPDIDRRLPGTAYDQAIKPCGRLRLCGLQSNWSTLLDVKVRGACGDAPLSPRVQVNTFTFQLAAEGNCGWMDRTRQLLFQDQGVVIQQRGCREWFEYFLIPFKHFIPVANDFENLAQDVSPYLRDVNRTRAMISDAQTFARDFLSEKGMMSYLFVLLSGISRVLNYTVNTDQSLLITSPQNVTFEVLFQGVSENYSTTTSNTSNSLTNPSAATSPHNTSYNCFCDDYASYAASSPALPLHLTTPCDAMTNAWRQRLDAYFRFHAESTRRDPRTTKFLVASTQGGIGNRVFSLMSSFLLAVLTDRVFLVCQEVENNIRNLFVRPCFEWLISDYRKEIEQSFSFSATDECKIFIPAEGPRGRPERIRELKCMDPRVVYANCSVLVVQSHQYYVPLLLENPFLRDSLREFFPDGNLFQLLRGVLFRPHEELLHSVQSGIQHLALDPSQALGIQLRARMFLNSAMENVTNEPRIMSFVKCVERLLPEKHLSHGFLATDRLEVQNILQSSLGANHVCFFPMEVHNTGETRELPDERRALVDLLTAASCVARVTTFKSTYGTVLRSFAQSLSFDGETCTLYSDYEAEFQMRGMMGDGPPCEV